MTLSEKAAYIQGLAEGLSLDESTKEGKLLAALIDLVGEMADAIGEIDEDLDTLNDYIEEIDEDLGDVEEVECPACGELICFDGSIDPEELACPACGEKFECIIAEEDLNALDEQ